MLNHIMIHDKEHIPTTESSQIEYTCDINVLETNPNPNPDDRIYGQHGTYQNNWNGIQTTTRPPRLETDEI